MDGFGVDEGTLEAVAGHLTSASGALDAGVGAAVPTPDAGKSSGAVAAALEMVGQAGVVFAENLTGMVSAIDLSDASYADVENNNAGAYRYQQVPTEVAGDSGPLKDAGDRPHNLPAQRPR